MRLGVSNDTPMSIIQCCNVKPRSRTEFAIRQRIMTLRCMTGMGYEVLRWRIFEHFEVLILSCLAFWTSPKHRINSLQIAQLTLYRQLTSKWSNEVCIIWYSASAIRDITGWRVTLSWNQRYRLMIQDANRRGQLTLLVTLRHTS